MVTTEEGRRASPEPTIDKRTVLGGGGHPDPISSCGETRNPTSRDALLTFSSLN